MAEPESTIWIYGVTYAEGRHGGWGYVETTGPAARGAAGGERGAGAQRMALAGLVSALRTADSAGPAIVRAAPVLAQAGRDLAARLADAEPWDDRDLWAQIAGLANKRSSVAFVPFAVPPRAGSSAAFVAAWADFALGKVKTAGPFLAAIPKPNLRNFPRSG